MPFVEEVLYVSGPARAGTVYRERTKLGGLPATEQWEIVEYKPMSRQVHVSFAHAMESALVISFEARGTGTWVHQAAELRSTLGGRSAGSTSCWRHSPRGMACGRRSPAPSGRSRKASADGGR